MPTVTGNPKLDSFGEAIFYAGDETTKIFKPFIAIAIVLQVFLRLVYRQRLKTDY